MKLVIDMSLSPGWVDGLARHGIESIHWSTVGAATAPDYEVLSWARDQAHVVVTHDLDFSAILAASSDVSPSVIQLRMQDLMSERAVESVVTAVRVHAEALSRGALQTNGNGHDEARFARARDAFGAPRHTLLYRSWLRNNAAVMKDVVSPVLADAIARRTGQLETHVLAHPYPHLVPLVTTA